MSGDIPPPQQQPAAPPTEPGPGASRDAWKAWRHEQRDYFRAQGHPGGWYGSWGWWGGGWFWGLALVVIGAYYLLRNLGLLDWLRGDVLLPTLIILLGLYLIFRRSRGWWSR